MGFCMPLFGQDRVERKVLANDHKTGFELGSPRVQYVGTLTTRLLIDYYYYFIISLLHSSNTFYNVFGIAVWA